MALMALQIDFVSTAEVPSYLSSPDLVSDVVLQKLLGKIINSCEHLRPESTFGSLLYQ